jgi:hypothetical protein
MAQQAPQSNEIKMPDASAWDGFSVPQEAAKLTEPYGRVVGMDYEQWAVAWEDARQKPERLTSRARALEAKGFRELTGQALLVHGVDSAVRVWVMPRHLYQRRREASAQTLVDGVYSGRYPDSALSVGNTRTLRK